VAAFETVPTGAERGLTCWVLGLVRREPAGCRRAQRRLLAGIRTARRSGWTAAKRHLGPYSRAPAGREISAVVASNSHGHPDHFRRHLRLHVNLRETALRHPEPPGFLRNPRALEQYSSLSAGCSDWGTTFDCVVGGRRRHRPPGLAMSTRPVSAARTPPAPATFRGLEATTRAPALGSTPPTPGPPPSVDGGRGGAPPVPTSWDCRKPLPSTTTSPPPSTCRPSNAGEAATPEASARASSSTPISADDSPTGSAGPSRRARRRFRHRPSPWPTAGPRPTTNLKNVGPFSRPAQPPSPGDRVGIRRERARKPTTSAPLRVFHSRLARNFRASVAGRVRPDRAGAGAPLVGRGAGFRRASGQGPRVGHRRLLDLPAPRRSATTARPPRAASRARNQEIQRPHHRPLPAPPG